MALVLLPDLLRDTLIDLGAPAVDSWWEALTEIERRSVIELWLSVGQPCGVRVVAEPAEGVEPDFRSPLWHDDFYEYLVNHEIYILEEDPFHICTRHPAAMAVIKAGSIPADYVCPFAQQDCPMRKLTGMFPNTGVRLRIAFSPSNALGAAAV